MGTGGTLRVVEYVDAEGRIPFREWMASLDTAMRARIDARLFRFSAGNLGDHKSVGHGVHEARVMHGPGYRIYFGRHGRELIVLLVGGDKSTQSRDISRAYGLWADYLKEKSHGAKK